MIEDKLVRCSLWVGEVASSNLAYHKYRFNFNQIKIHYLKVLWQSGYCEVLLILFLKGSIPFNALFSIDFIINKFKRNKILYIIIISEHVEIGKQSLFKQEWK